MKTCPFITFTGQRCSKKEAGPKDEYCSTHLPKMDAVELLFVELREAWKESPS